MRLSNFLKNSFVMASMLVSAGASAQTDIYPDTWVATDDLDRVAPTSAESPLRTDKNRTVGIFYVSWHDNGKHTSMPAPYGADVTKILQEDPNARLQVNHPLWNRGRSCHWGEPELGYFCSRDPYVIRRDISMLADAGVDVLILDCTNGVTYPLEWDALLDVMTQMKAEGNVVPKVCWWVFNGHPDSSAQKIYEYYYVAGRYRDLWFYWDGKPLLLYNSNPNLTADGAQTERGYSKEVLNYFTLRNMWWGYYIWNDEIYVGTEDNWCFGYDMHNQSVWGLKPEKRAALHNGRIEQMAVTPAQHAVTVVGKSFRVKNFKYDGEPSLDNYDMPQRTRYNGKYYYNPEKYGFYFQDRWDEAIDVDPDFIYLNDWNEWTAGMFATPGKFLNRDNEFYFVDQYNAEFNRTIQPMKGGYTDNYYMQMVQNIRRYKGVRPAPVAYFANELDCTSSAGAWDEIEDEYLDTYGDVDHRDYVGYGGMHYTNNSGRNDILRTKVAMGKENVTFRVTTASALTPYTDRNWMLLLIDSDCNHSTGWYGYDYIVNKAFESSSLTCVMKYDSEKQEWVKVGSAEFAVDGKVLTVTIPQSMIGLEAADRGSFYFKWADNPASLETPISLCTDGDTAPNRRFNYNYQWDFAGSGIEDITIDGSEDLTAIGGEGTITVRTLSGFTVYSVTGAVVAQGTGKTEVDSLVSGLYIVTNGLKSAKVLVR